MALNPARPHTFSATLKAPRILQGPPHFSPVLIVEEYEIRGSVRVRMAPPALDSSVQSVYDAAVRQLDNAYGQKRLASASNLAAAAFSVPPVTVALGRALNEPRASATAPIDHSLDGDRPMSRPMTG
jgi:hypothetical protein